MSALDDLHHSDPTRRRQAITLCTRSGSEQALPALRNIQQGDPVLSLREFAGKAIELIEQHSIPKDDFMTTVDKRRTDTMRQVAAAAEQQEGGTQRNLLPFVIFAVVLFIAAFLIFANVVNFQ